VVSSGRLARVGGLAAILGGLTWVVKSVGILITGEQPPIVFELGPPLFALGLIGLHARLEGRGGRAAEAGLVLACVTIALSLVMLLAWAFARELLPAGEDEFTPISLVIAGASLSLVAALVLLGAATRRVQAFPTPWKTLPLAMGILIVPGIAIGGILSQLNERLLEIPLVAFALAWVLTGYLIWSAGEREPDRA